MLILINFKKMIYQVSN